MNKELGINPLNAELNPICHLLALLGGATIVVVSRLRVKVGKRNNSPCVVLHIVTKKNFSEKKLYIFILRGLNNLSEKRDFFFNTNHSIILELHVQLCASDFNKN